MKSLARLTAAASLATIGALAPLAPASADVSLGAFTFDSNLFGNTLVESDGGAFSATNWLNVVNANPGNPGVLTGANFNTGIANIGLGGTPSYTIGYGTAIANGAGADIGVVTARFSVDDTITLSINGNTLNFGAALGIDSGVDVAYVYQGSVPQNASLFVTLIDLSDFGVAAGDTINSVGVTGAPQLDLIRVAGLAGRAAEVPEPVSLALLGVGLAGLGVARRMRRG